MSQLVVDHLYEFGVSLEYLRAFTRRLLAICMHFAEWIRHHTVGVVQHPAIHSTRATQRGCAGGDAQHHHQANHGQTA
eukprot:CAMPEP_0197042912 /NCGR_PEP_ID=MMETSP1384-20130603/19227_1 /TAXON_ID=29189 /ORGANISM="Ammonia sp." /LENGTH=77 /DNA_ID=CAMNT_0042474109 /DNA_START=58 /DNA_END=288 /DNA_ORIENTATION=+